jgi:type I restriction enzyme S subunit
MVVEKGYKQTEVGVIPEEWEVVRIGDIANCFSGGTPNTEIREYYSGNINWLSSSELNKGRIFETNEFISDLGLKNSSSKLVPPGTFLLAMYGATAGVSAITYVEGAINQAVLAIVPRTVIAEYLFQFFTLNKDVIVKTYTQGGQPNLSGGIIKSISIPLPKKETEQTAIATALSDMDALIAQTEKLIEKKKAIKQGVMQELLKPKEGWVTKKLGELIYYKNGKAHENCVVENGDYVIVNSKFISSDGQIAKYSNENLCPVEKDEILMVLSDIPNGKAIAKCFYVNKNNKYTLNQRICSLKAIDIHPKFLYYLVNRNDYFLAFDDGVKQTNLRNEDVLKCPITFPQDYNKQEQSAQIITELEMGLELLNIKHQKLKLQKQGMMQALLTGKIRLI